jgi:hypothetical protein
MSRHDHQASNAEAQIDRRLMLKTGAVLASTVALLKGRVAVSRSSAAPATGSMEGTNDMAYQLEGRLLEACNCEVLCPCWVGEDPDPGTCDAVVAWHVDRGVIDGIDVSGRTIAIVNFIPGNIFDGNWKLVFFVDEAATPEQHEALLSVWTGERGGPVADLAQLYGEVIAVEQAPILFTIVEGQGTLRIGAAASPVVEAEMAPLQGATGKSTTLADTVFSTIPGSPAYVGKTDRFRRKTSHYGLHDLDLTGRNAIQGTFNFAA